MSLLGIHILSDAALKALKDAGHQVETVALNELDKAVVAAKSTSLGATVVATVKEVENSTDTGPQKLAKSLSIIVPEVISYASKGGTSALVADAETFAKQLIESTLADLKQTGVVKIGEALLSVFGVKLPA